MNHILCPECHARLGGEEKCCTHGCGLVTCVECGKVRTEADPYWTCTGTMRQDDSMSFRARDVLDEKGGIAYLLAPPLPKRYET